MAEEAWHEARLIPTSGINGAEEQERRGTSALLAVLFAVREFGRALTQPFGAPIGPIHTYIEVPFELDGHRLYPDGLIRVTRGQKTWTALVEVKTGTNELKAEQLESYLDLAREQGFQALITISNEVPAIAGQHPTKVDRRKLKRVDLFHLSWMQVLSEAVMQMEHRGVADPDQAWILGELIRYLEHTRSGAMEFQDMGSSWVPVRDALSAGTLRATDKGAPEVASRFDALLRFAGLRLGRQLGIEVTPVLSRRELTDPSVRSTALCESLAASGTMAGAIRIPNTVGTLAVTVDLRASLVTCEVDVDAPRQGRPLTRVNWLVRQLKDAPATVRIESYALHGRGASSAALLRDLRAEASGLIGDPKRELRTFRIAVTSKLGTKRGIGRASFIDSVLAAIDGFYADVMQHVKAWSAAPPRMRDPEEIAVKPPVALSSTAISSQDGPEVVAESADSETSVPDDIETPAAQA